MRIISGKHRGKRLLIPPQSVSRPTSARVRESIFNILQHTQTVDNLTLLEGTTVLDAYAGSGALGLEALSRGAKFVYFMEKDYSALSIIRQNIVNLKETKTTQVLDVDVQKIRCGLTKVDIIFLDPPYHQKLIEPSLRSLVNSGCLQKGTRIIVETANSEAISWPVDIEICGTRTYGRTNISIAIKL
jgi:16S rRNA (guanine966-N2)-methyltransferase